jgi:hypothetical protein
MQKCQNAVYNPPKTPNRKFIVLNKTYCLALQVKTLYKYTEENSGNHTTILVTPRATALSELSMRPTSGGKPM